VKCLCKTVLSLGKTSKLIIHLADRICRNLSHAVVQEVPLFHGMNIARYGLNIRICVENCGTYGKQRCKNTGTLLKLGKVSLKIQKKQKNTKLHGAKAVMSVWIGSKSLKLLLHN